RFADPLELLCGGLSHIRSRSFVERLSVNLDFQPIEPCAARPGEKNAERYADRVGTDIALELVARPIRRAAAASRRNVVQRDGTVSPVHTPPDRGIAGHAGRFHPTAHAHAFSAYQFHRELLGRYTQSIRRRVYRLNAQTLHARPEFGGVERIAI